MESCPTQAVRPLVGLAAEKVMCDRYKHNAAIGDGTPVRDARRAARRQVAADPRSGRGRLVAVDFSSGGRGRRGGPSCQCHFRRRIRRDSSQGTRGGESGGPPVDRRPGRRAPPCPG
ncbi:MAG: hypothetical protein R6U98_27895 [Pirellulaceae bacterium]